MGRPLYRRAVARSEIAGGAVTAPVAVEEVFVVKWERRRAGEEGR